MTREEALELLTQKGFIACFFRRIGNNPGKTSIDVYESIEKDHKDHFGKRKYSNYDSFRRLKIRYLNSLKCKS